MIMRKTVIKLNGNEINRLSKMKRIIVIAEIILLGIAGCGGEKQTTDDLITHVSHLSFAPFAPLGAEYR